MLLRQSFAVCTEKPTASCAKSETKAKLNMQRHNASRNFTKKFKLYNETHAAAGHIKAGVRNFSVLGVATTFVYEKLIVHHRICIYVQKTRQQYVYVDVSTAFQRTLRKLNIKCRKAPCYWFGRRHNRITFTHHSSYVNSRRLNHCHPCVINSNSIISLPLFQFTFGNEIAARNVGSVCHLDGIERSSS